MDNRVRGLVLAGVATVSLITVDHGSSEIPDFGDAKMWHVRVPERNKPGEQKADVEAPFAHAVGLVLKAIQTGKAKADSLIAERAKNQPGTSTIEHLRSILGDLNKKMDDRQKETQKNLIKDLQGVVSSINKSLAKIAKPAQPQELVERDALLDEMAALKRRIGVLFGHRSIGKQNTTEEIIEAFARWELEHRLHKEGADSPAKAKQ